MWQSVPQDLVSIAQKREQQFAEHALRPSDALIKTLCISDYVADSLLQNPWLAAQLEQLEQPYSASQMATQLTDALAQASDEHQLQKQLRQFRRFHQVRIIHRDINGLADLRHTLGELTALADVCIEHTLNWHEQHLRARYGEPIGKRSKQVQSLVVLAMGKQGAGELNLSSDIDLIFSYPESGYTNGESIGKKELSNQEYFLKLGQGLIQSLDKITADGFVFRVDMRLRPNGQSGPLVMNFSAMENYYHDQGREWERYAMIKARAVTGKPEHRDELMSILRPFSYRAYVDFSAFESLREMKSMINREVQRRNLDTNVKLGSGGIREVEFIAQAFQLIRGGQEKALQEPNIFKVMAYLQGEGYLPHQAVEELMAAYVFLRDTEHAIQCIRDEQSQTLPDDATNQARIAWRMGFNDWSAFSTALQQHRQHVAHHFAQIVAADDDDQQDQDDLSFWQSVWHHDTTAVNEQPEHSASDEHAALSDTVQTLLDKLRHNHACLNMQAVARERLEKTMPRLLAAIWERPEPEQTLERIIPLIEAILRRTAYLVLLNENPQALQQVVKLCGASPWIAESLATSPILLDELLNPAHLYNPSSKADMKSELEQRLLRISEDDLEEQMDALRHFAQAQKLHIAASDIAGVLPLMKVSDHLTWLAETLLEKVMWLAWQQMVAKYGYPTNSDKQAVTRPEFIILGYGKMGGIELSYGSDLDLVFLHNGTPNKYTTGERELENGVFYTRMGQRIIHIMNTTTRAGQLYEVDMRLRPSGASGMIVASLSGFEKYQAEEAWTWEHQALIRARVLCAGDGLEQSFLRIRQQILAKPKELAALQQEVREMRQKMRDNLGSQSVGKAEFQLKQDAGGIVDIEFMVQYMVLAQSQHHAELLEFTDNVRILEGLQTTGLLDATEAEALKQAYIAYRSLAHRRALQNQKLLLAPSELDQAGLSPHIETVKALWQKIMCTAP